MGGLFGALRAADLALQAQQQVMNVTANNVANAQTPGYSREEADLVAAPGYPVVSLEMPATPGQVGTGVEVASILRDRSHFLDLQAWAGASSAAQLQTAQNTLTQVETIFNEPSSTGLSAAMTAFWNAWQNLANNPTDAAARQGVIAQGQALAETWNGIASSLGQLRANLDADVAAQVGSVNRIAGQIAQLNQQIVAVTATGQSPNGLLDQRDALLGQLAQLVQFQERRQADGSDTVSVGGVNLVQGDVTTTLLATPDPTNGNLLKLSWQGTAAQVPAGLGGSLGETLALRDNVIPGYQAQLDTIAGALATAVNGFPNPAAAPTVTAGSGPSTLPAGTYQVAYTFTTAQGETEASPLATVTIAAGQSIDLAAIAPPPGATGVNYYLSAPGGTTLSLAASGSGAPISLTAPPAAGAASPPATGLGHAGGYGLSGMTGQAFFTGTTAATIAVNAALAAAPDDLAAAAQPAAPGDGSNALAIADLRNAPLVGTATVGSAYAALIARIGTDAGAAKDALQNQQLLNQRIQEEQQAVAGVNLDEELTRLVSSQHAYQAAADVIAVINQMLGSLINGLGLG